MVQSGSSVLFNTSDVNGYTSSGETAYANTVQMADGWTRSFDYVDEILNGRPFSIAGSFSDDYIDLSGLSQNDFNQSLNFWDIGVSVSPGNDQIFNSNMTHTIDGVTVPVGMLQAHDYFDAHWGDQLDKSQGLQINFAESYDAIVFNDFANGFRTDAYGFNIVETSSMSNDEVIGNSNPNGIISAGATILFLAAVVKIGSQ